MQKTTPTCCRTTPIPSTGLYDCVCVRLCVCQVRLYYVLSLSALLSVQNVSQNGSRLVHLNGEITKQVEVARQVASLADMSATVTLNMVSDTRFLSGLEIGLIPEGVRVGGVHWPLDLFSVYFRLSNLKEGCQRRAEST